MKPHHGRKSIFYLRILNYAITEDDCDSVKISLSQLFPNVPLDKIIVSFDLDVVIIYPNSSEKDAKSSARRKVHL